METERISVVVPAYNNAPWLPRCLDSLLAQTYGNLEIIVVNDGSKDDTKAVLDGYAAKHSNIHAIHKENGGVTSARLAGVAAATGDWIGFVDGDDTVEETMFAHLLENANTHQADISHCGHRVLFPDGRVEFVHGTGEKRCQDRLTGIRELLDGGQIESSLCTKLFKRELFENLAEKMDPAMKNGEDYLMNYYLFAKAERAVYEDICPYYYICAMVRLPTGCSMSTVCLIPSGYGRRSCVSANRNSGTMPRSRCCATACLLMGRWR